MRKCKNILFFLLAAVTFAACTNTNEKMSKCENEKTELSFSAEQAVWMRAIACDEAKGDLMAPESAIHTQEQPGATNEWLEPVSETQYNNLSEREDG